MAYQDSQPLGCLAWKSNYKFEVLLVKVFSVKQKKNQIALTTIEKIKFYPFKKTASCSLRL